MNHARKKPEILSDDSVAYNVELWTDEALDSEDEYGHNADGHVLRIAAADEAHANRIVKVLNDAVGVDLA